MPAAAPRSNAILGAALLLLAASGASAQCPPTEKTEGMIIFDDQLPTNKTVPGFPLYPDVCCPAGTSTLDITFQFDELAGDIEWKLLNADGNAVYRRDCQDCPFRALNFQQSQFYTIPGGFKWTDRVCLEPGQYKLKVMDSIGDGMVVTFFEQTTQTATSGATGAFIKLTWQDCAGRSDFVYGPVSEAFQEFYFGSDGYDDLVPSNGVPALEFNVAMFPAGFNCDVDSCNPDKCTSGVTQHTVRFFFDVTPDIVNGYEIEPATGRRLLGDPPPTVFVPPKSWTLYKGHASDPTTLPVLKNKTSLEPLYLNIPQFEESFCLGPGKYTLVVNGSDAGEGLFLPIYMHPNPGGVDEVSPAPADGSRIYKFEICSLGFKFTNTYGCKPRSPTCIGATIGRDYTGDDFSGDRFWPDEKFCVEEGEDVGRCIDCGTAPNRVNNGTNCMSGELGLREADGEYWHYTNGTRAEVGFALDLFEEDPLLVQWVKQIKYKPAVVGKIKAVIVQVSGAGDCGYKNLGAWTSFDPECGGSLTCDATPGDFTKRIRKGTGGDVDWEFIDLPDAPGAIGTPAKFVSLTFIVAKAGDFKMDMIDLVQCSSP